MWKIFAKSVPIYVCKSERQEDVDKVKTLTWLSESMSWGPGGHEDITGRHLKQKNTSQKQKQYGSAAVLHGSKRMSVSTLPLAQPQYYGQAYFFCHWKKKMMDDDWLSRTVLVTVRRPDKSKKKNPLKAQKQNRVSHFVLHYFITVCINSRSPWGKQTIGGWKPRKLSKAAKYTNSESHVAFPYTNNRLHDV